MSSRMDAPQPEPSPLLDHISTPWNLLFQVQSEAQSSAARYALVLRYYIPLRRYAFGVLRNESDSNDVAQELVVRLMEGNLSLVRPDRGRFRDYLKAAVRNAALDLRRRIQMQPIDNHEPHVGDHVLDTVWVAAWRESVLEYAWIELDSYQRRRPGNLFWSVLKLRQDNPELPMAELAARLSTISKHPVQEGACRQTLHRARSLFANILARIVSNSLEDPSPTEIRRELQELGLWEGCREFLPDLTVR